MDAIFSRTGWRLAGRVAYGRRISRHTQAGEIMSAVGSTAESAATRVDPVTASIIQGALENIAIEMGYKLMRMAYSSIIRESEDFGAAICDAQGRQLCECSMSTPLQSGPI